MKEYAHREQLRCLSFEELGDHHELRVVDPNCLWHTGFGIARRLLLLEKLLPHLDNLCHKDLAHLLVVLLALQ